MTFKKTGLLLGALLMAQAAHANLLVNPSFEDVSANEGVQTQTAGTWLLYDALPGWTTTAGVQVRNARGGTAYEGDNFIQLDAGGTLGNSSISQSVATAAGSLYKLSFEYSARIRIQNKPADTDAVAVYWNGVPLATLDLPSQNQHNWVNYSFSVVGTGNDKLTFEALGRTDGFGGSLDNVILTAVPEPSRLALALGGLGLMALSPGLRRRMRRS